MTDGRARRLDWPDLDDPRMQRAIQEMQALIRERYPDATFSVAYGEDPAGIYLDVMVDVEDMDEVVDVYIDRLVDLQVEEGLKLHVIPVRPPERIEAMLRERASESAGTPKVVAAS